ncbi:MAG: DUF362 domain-containing protein [Bacteroidales bacterium]|nr:DUF362 domain-containing protein [Bacteroidales bacterium]
MKRVFILAAAVSLALCSCKTKADAPVAEICDEPQEATVYMTSDISPEGLVRIYEALGVPATGRVAVKISTGEPTGHHYLQPDLIKELVQKVNGTIVECNTAYNGRRRHSEEHWKVIEEHGFKAIAPVDIMDEEGEMQLPVRDTTYIKCDIVGSHLANYDFLINLSHFKGHQMGGFGGALKNQSIGVASSAGKAYIHSNGRNTDPDVWHNFTEAEHQDKFLECMATAATAVADHFGKNIIYINVMNNLSIDCDCNGNPSAPKLKDVGILASTDPVALDEACYQLVINHPNSEGDDASELVSRINKQHGHHTIEHAEAIGLGTTKYHIVNIDEK